MKTSQPETVTSRKMKNTGTDRNSLEAFRAKQIKSSLKMGMSQEQAEANAEMLAGMYGHHFRRYE